jgi:hypothetical protein
LICAAPCPLSGVKRGGGVQDYDAIKLLKFAMS